MKKKPTILLLNWVTISKKQGYQLASIEKIGFRIQILTNDFLGESAEVIESLGSSAKLHKADTNPLRRLLQLFQLLKMSTKGSICIIPPVGRFSLVTVCICRAFGLRVISVEWGDIGNQRNLSTLMKTSMRLCYQFSHAIWYKEPFMRPLLMEFGARNCVFIPNAVPVVQSGKAFVEKDIDFLWVNRLVATQRRPDWFVGAVNNLSSRNKCRASLLGFLPRGAASQPVLIEQERVLLLARSGPVEVHEFVNPTIFYGRSKFFVLAASHIYGNNSVLEAMASGIVPIVTQSPDVELLVLDGWNGFVCDNDPDSLESAMSSALSLSAEEWEVLSCNAIRHVREQFSVAKWEQSMSCLLLSEKG